MLIYDIYVSRFVLQYPKRKPKAQGLASRWVYVESCRKSIQNGVVVCGQHCWPWNSGGKTELKTQMTSYPNQICFKFHCPPVKSRTPDFLKESMLLTARRSSSSCTGAFTAEMSWTAMEKTINRSGFLRRPVRILPVSCHVSWIYIFFENYLLRGSSL